MNNRTHHKEKICACYTEGKSLCGNEHSLNTIIHSNVTCEECLAILKKPILGTADERVKLLKAGVTGKEIEMLYLRLNGFTVVGIDPNDCSGS